MNAGRVELSEDRDIERGDAVMAPSLDYLDALLTDIPPGSWVAVSESQQKVLAYGADAQTVVDAARADGERLPLIVRKPKQDMLMYF